MSATIHSDIWALIFPNIKKILCALNGTASPFILHNPGFPELDVNSDNLRIARVNARRQQKVGDIIDRGHATRQYTFI